MYAVDSSKYRWVGRNNVINPSKPHGFYRLVLNNYWIVNDSGDLLFWYRYPQCNPDSELAAALLHGSQPHLDTEASLEYIDRAWVEVDPRDYC